MAGFAETSVQVSSTSLQANKIFFKSTILSLFMWPPNDRDA